MSSSDEGQRVAFTTTSVRSLSDTEVIIENWSAATNGAAIRADIAIKDIFPEASDRTSTNLIYDRIDKSLRPEGSIYKRHFKDYCGEGQEPFDPDVSVSQMNPGVLGDVYVETLASPVGEARVVETTTTTTTTTVVPVVPVVSPLDVPATPPLDSPRTSYTNSPFRASSPPTSVSQRSRSPSPPVIPEVDSPLSSSPPQTSALVSPNITPPLSPLSEERAISPYAVVSPTPGPQAVGTTHYPFPAVSP